MERSKCAAVAELSAEKALISLIASYLNGENADGEVYRSIGVSALLALSKRWSLEVITMDALEAQHIFDQEELKAWAERRQRLQVQSVVQQGEAQALKKLFVDHGLHVLPLKGYYMKGMYPKPEQRQMCDLDFLLGEQEMEQARALMEGRGYVTEHFQEGNHDNYRKKPFLYVELHRRLLAEDSPYAAGLGDMFQRAVQCPEGEYEVNWSDYYLFLLVHFSKHMEWAGCGPRSVLDVYIFRRAYGDQLDQVYLQQRLSNMGLEKFRCDVEEIAECWFAPNGKGKDLTEHAQAMANEMLGSAVYGTWQKSMETRLRKEQQEYGNAGRAGLHYLWSRVFLPRRTMEGMYPVLGRWPVLLPACWLLRCGRMMFVTPTRSWKRCSVVWHSVQQVKKKKQKTEK